MVLARREIRHLGILAARNPSFGNSGGQKSVIREFWRPEIRHSEFLAARNLPFRGILVARNSSFGNSGGAKSLFIYMYFYVYGCVYVVIRPWFLHGEKSVIREFMAARNPSVGNSGGQKSAIRNFWRPDILHSGILAAICCH